MSDADKRTIVDLLIDQVEFANVIVINKCDLPPEAEVARLEGILRSLNPDARLIRVTHGRIDPTQVLGTGLFDEERASRMPGWVKELNGEHVPETEEYGIGSFVYRRRVPFHPQRLMDALQGGFKGVVRSKGYLWIATRPRSCGVWSQAGSSLQIDRAGLWFAAVPKDRWPDDPETRAWIEAHWDPTVGDCRQEIVFIGVEMDRGAIEAALDAALLSDAEIAAGVESWATLDDPIPSWEPAEAVGVEREPAD